MSPNLHSLSGEGVAVVVAGLSESRAQEILGPLRRAFSDLGCISSDSPASCGASGFERFPIEVATSADGLARIGQRLTAILVLASASRAEAVGSRLSSLQGIGAAPVLVVVDAPVALIPAPRDSLVMCVSAQAGAESIAGALTACIALAPTFRQQQELVDREERLLEAAGRRIETQEQELRLATLLQRELLPGRLPSVPGLEIGAVYRPGTSVSGDAYDVFRLDEHHVGIFVADAAGHGVSAALTMMIVTRLLPHKDADARGYRVVPPGEALTRLNRLFMDRRGELCTMVTAAYAIIDTRDGRVRLAQAGSPPAVIAGAGEGSGATGDGGVARLIREGGLPLGVDERVTYTETLARMDIGQSLLLHTDGLERVMGVSDATLVGGILGEVMLGAEPDVNARLADLESRMDRQRGSLHQADDVTLVAALRTAPSETVWLAA